jgi:hypothetical protein
MRLAAGFRAWWCSPRAFQAARVRLRRNEFPPRAMRARSDAAGTGTPEGGAVAPARIAVFTVDSYAPERIWKVLVEELQVTSR